MTPYPKYKPSGIEWIGEIPEQWEVKKLKYELDFFNNIRIPLSSEERGKLEKVYDYYGASGVIDKVNNYIFDGDYILIGEDGANLLTRSTALAFKASGKFWVNNHAHILRPKNGNIDYFIYLLESIDYAIYVSGSAQPKLTIDNLANIEIIVSPNEEQEIIANYLNSKTAQIDTCITKKQNLIELLKEEKTAIINEAVTKGINPDVKLKPSGIEWLGDVPEHWEVKKLKYLVSKIGSGVTPSGGASVYQTSGIPLLRSQNVHFDGLRLEDVAYITPEIDESMKNSRVETGDVLLNITGASIGRCYYLEDNFGKGNVNQHVCILRPIQKAISTKYLYMLMYSAVGQTQIDLLQTGANREGLNFEQLRNFNLPVPSINEQKTIILYFEKQTSKIDHTISRIEKEIELMQEYRVALISEVVTGKAWVNNKP